MTLIRFSLLSFWLCVCIATTLGQEKLPNTQNGLIERFEDFPTSLIAPRHIDVWLPEGYDQEKSYAVIYMHDGQMLFDSTTTWNKQEWQVDEVLSKLISDNKIPPVIVVGIHNSTTRHADYFPQKAFEILPENIIESYMPSDSIDRQNSEFPSGPQADAYIEFLVNELKPFIDQNFATKPDRDHTFIAGSSMGGLISMYAMWEHPEVFGGAACMSTHWIGGFSDVENPVPGAFLHYMVQHMPSPENHKIWFDHGTEGLDKMYTNHQLNVNFEMEKAGYILGDNYQSKVYDGADHNETSWANRLDDIFAYLLSK